MKIINIIMSITMFVLWIVFNFYKDQAIVPILSILIGWCTGQVLFTALFED